MNMQTEMEPRTNADKRRWASGYTLIEMLVVLAIIMGMMSLIMTSVSSMLQSSRMSRTLSLLVGAVDEARTSAISFRRSTKLDLTRIDAEGKLNRLTTTEPSFIDNFDSYADTDGSPPTPTPSNNGWSSTSGFNNNNSQTPSIYYDGTRCLRMQNGSTYTNVCSHMDTVKQTDFEQIIMARVKFLPQQKQGGSGRRAINVYAAMKETSGGSSYCMVLQINPSQVELKGGGGLATVPNATTPLVNPVPVDPGKTACLIENVWYRVALSVKRSTIPGANSTSQAIVAGKIWADGQLEPQRWTVGPALDSSPGWNGPGGFKPEGCDALLDDVLFDGRAIRVLPEGLRVDAIDPTTAPNTDPTTVAPVADDSPYSFPIQFRPDGTTAQKYIVRLTDLSSGDRSYLAIDQNTGRARMCNTLREALKQ